MILNIYLYSVRHDLSLRNKERFQEEEIKMYGR